MDAPDLVCTYARYVYSAGCREPSTYSENKQDSGDFGIAPRPYQGDYL